MVMDYLIVQPLPKTAPRFDAGCMVWRDEMNHMRIVTQHPCLTQEKLPTFQSKKIDKLNQPRELGF